MLWGCAIYGSAVYCVVRAVLCVVGRCTMWYGGVQCVRMVYCMVGRYTVW